MLEPSDIDLALDELRRHVCLRPAIVREFELSRADYFGAAPKGSDDEARRAARRHLEWFLLERPSAALDAVPVEWAFERRAELGSSALTEEQLRALLASRCGVFAVTGVAAGEGVWVRDLAATGEYPLREPEGSHALAAGDVIVGRLFAIGDALYRVSPAAGVFRSEHLLRALEQDIELLRKGRRGVLRLSQVELEAMFWHRMGGVPPDAVGRARAFFVQSGLDHQEVDALLADLARMPFEDLRVVVGARDVLGEILDRLAFDTSVDLEQARRVLIDAWPLLNPDIAPARPMPDEQAPPKDVLAAIEAFDRGRHEGRDLETLFRQLEDDLQLGHDEPDPDALDGAPAPDFPGVVGAMVEEFLWELEREQGAEAASERAILRAFSEFGADYGVFENLGARELVLFTSVWLPERRVLGTTDDARRMLRALREFCGWSQANQDVALLDAYRAALVPLEESLPRMVEANRWCESGGLAGASELFELVEAHGGAVQVRDRHGDVHAVQLDPRIARALRPGDRLRARRTEQGFTPFCCYPQQSALIAPL